LEIDYSRLPVADYYIYSVSVAHNGTQYKALSAVDKNIEDKADADLCPIAEVFDEAEGTVAEAMAWQGALHRDNFPSGCCCQQKQMMPFPNTGYQGQLDAIGYAWQYSRSIFLS